MGGFRQQTDEQILDRAAALFARHGFEQTSVQEVADAVGLSKAGLLHHFPSKDALHAAVLAHADAPRAGRCSSRSATCRSGPRATAARSRPSSTSPWPTPAWWRCCWRRSPRAPTTRRRRTPPAPAPRRWRPSASTPRRPTAGARACVRVVGALAALAVLTLAAHQQDQTTAWRPLVVATCFDALGHRRPGASRPIPTRWRPDPHGSSVVPTRRVLPPAPAGRRRSSGWPCSSAAASAPPRWPARPPTAFSIPGQESTAALDLITEEFGAGGRRHGPGGRPGAGRQHPDRPRPNAAARAGTGRRARPAARASRRPATRWTRRPRRSTPTRPPPTARSPTPPGPASVTVEQQDALLAAVDDRPGLRADRRGRRRGARRDPGGRAASASSLGVVVALLVLALTYGSLAAGRHEPAHRGHRRGHRRPRHHHRHRLPRPVLDHLGAGRRCSAWPSASTTRLFIVSRYRQELRGGRRRRRPPSPPRPAPPARRWSPPALTVVIALVGLSVVGIPFLTQMGIAAAATIVVAVLVALTLVPAVLGFLGARALPRRQRSARRPDHRRARRGAAACWPAGSPRSPGTGSRPCCWPWSPSASSPCPFFSHADHAGADAGPRTAPQARAGQLLADGVRRGGQRPAHRALRGRPARPRRPRRPAGRSPA